MDNRSFFLLCLVSFCFFGCAIATSIGWYTDYGITKREDLLKPQNIQLLLKVAKNDGNYKVRIKALKVLRRHHLNIDYLNELVEILNTDRRWDVSLVAADTLIVLGSGKKALPKLLKILKANDSDARIISIKIIQKLGYEAKGALPYLEVVARNDRIRVQSVARIAIKNITISVLSKEDEEREKNG